MQKGQQILQRKRWYFLIAQSKVWECYGIHCKRNGVLDVPKIRSSSPWYAEIGSSKCRPSSLLVYNPCFTVTKYLNLWTLSTESILCPGESGVFWVVFWLVGWVLWVFFLFFVCSFWFDLVWFSRFQIKDFFIQ